MEAGLTHHLGRCQQDRLKGRKCVDTQGQSTKNLVHHRQADTTIPIRLYPNMDGLRWLVKRSDVGSGLSPPPVLLSSGPRRLSNLEP